MKSLGAAASVVLIGIGLYVGYRLFSPALAPVLPGKCTVGYAGTHLQVNVEGIGAVAACNRAEQESSSWYQVDGPASGTLVCRQPLGRVHGLRQLRVPEPTEPRVDYPSASTVVRHGPFTGCR